VSGFLYGGSNIFGQKSLMSKGPESRLTLRQADQARTDFAAIESDLDAIMARLVRLPTRGDLAKTALGIILSTAALVILWAEVFWRL
jgi:hypothetical protein